MIHFKLNKQYALIGLLIISIQCLNSQILKKESYQLSTIENLILSGVSVKPADYKSKKSVRIELEPGNKGIDSASFAKLKDMDFKDGTIEVFLVGKLALNAPEWARGFVGIAFRITDDNSKFECFYLRPLNSPADDQARRSHSTQYISYPDYKFDRLRKESPGKYESYAPLIPGEWIKVRIEVNGSSAKLYVNDSEQAVLTVNDLKHGKDLHGSIGLWVDKGTEAYFSGLKITHLLSGVDMLEDKKQKIR
jgi:hypothetical protein